MSQIILTNYNLQEAEKTVITACINNNKEKSLEQIAILLKISHRTLYRKIKEYGINKIRLNKENKAICFLKENGYKVEKL